MTRRRRVVAVTSAAGAALLGVALSRRPASPQFYAATLAAAGIWTAGGLASGPVHLGATTEPDQAQRHPVLAPVATGVAAFGLFYGGALLARRVPLLNDALRGVLRFADEGTTALVLFTTLANGAAEEVFFRGALYTAAGPRCPVAVSTAAYALATVPTRNPALVLAATVMGTLFGLQRRATGGVQAPMLTHLTWATLMLRFLPPLFHP
ncbi:MAG: CPBP family intramembrane glutamic endopeptidase [Pseudonocardiaceae bacterium]